MSDIEDRVVRLLHNMAEESRPVTLTPLPHLDAVRRRRVTSALVAVAVAAVVAVAVAGSLSLVGVRRSATLEPAEQPPPTFLLSSTSSTRPGVARMAVTLSDAQGHTQPAAAYVVPRRGDAAIKVPPPSAGSYLPEQVLSADGRLVLRFDSEIGGVSPRLVLTNLLSGHDRQLGQAGGYAALSPDNHTLAIRDNVNLTLLDVDSGATRTLRHLGDSARVYGSVVGAEVGWSPDGRLLAVQDGNDILVIDRSGRVHARMADQSLVNGNLSWSPQGMFLLTYDRARSVFLVTAVEGGHHHALRSPPGALRALGWTGNRVVWLAGQPGAQSLLTTDDHGNAAKTWMRFAVGTRPVAGVTWSRALTG